jgi:hypothetical protein
MFGMVFCGLIAAEDRMLGVAVGQLRFMCRHRLIVLVTMFGGLAVMVRRPFMMVGGRSVVLRAGEGGRKFSYDFQARRGETRGCLERALQGTVAALRMEFSGFVPVIDGLPSVPVRDEGHMRRMGIVLPDLIMRRGLAVISHRLLMVNRRRSMMFCRLMFLGHDVSDRPSRVMSRTA